MALNLRKLGQQIVAQVNPFDNGRTFSHLAPTNNRSVIGQVTHNGIINTVGNMVVKPVVATAKTPVEAGRGVVAIATHNPAAQVAAAHRFAKNFDESIPGSVVNQGKAAVELGSTIPLAMATIKHGDRAPTQAERANLTKGLSALNRTTVGQMVGPAESLMNSFIPGAKEDSAAAGYDVNASGAKKYLADPAMGTLGTYGLLKGGQAVTRGTAKAAVGVKNRVEDTAAAIATKRDLNQAGSVPGKTIQIPVTKEGGGNIPIPTKVITKIPVRQIPSKEELVNRYNDHIAALNKEYGANQGKIMTAGKPGRQGILSEDSVYADAGYAAKRQAIEQQYKDGTLPKRIPVQEAPKTGVGRVRPDGSVVTKVQQLGDPTLIGKDKPTTSFKEQKLANNQVRADAQLKQMEKAGQQNTPEYAKLAGEYDAKYGKAPETPPTQPTPETQVPWTAPDSPAAMTAPEGPKWHDKLWVSTNGIISKFGETGKEIANRLEASRNRSEIGQEDFIRQTPSVWSLGKKDMELFARTLKERSMGNNPTAPPNIMRAVLEWNKAIPQIREQALKAGIDVGDLGPNYFPQIHKNLFTRASKMRDMANKIVEADRAKGKTTTFQQAMDQLNFAKKDYIKGNGNLDMSRIADLPGYEMTHDALASYLSRAFDSIAKAEQFGHDKSILNAMREQIAKEGHDISKDSTLDKALKVAFEDTNHNTNLHQASAFLRKVNALRSLNTAAVSNASQLTNTATIAGIGRTAKAIGKAMTPGKIGAEARAYAKSTGVELDHSINNLAASQLGVTGTIMRNIASPLFHKVERFNRTATAIVGKDYGDYLAKKGDVAELQRLGVKGEIGKTLTDEQAVQMSRGLVKNAQFKVDPMDLPMWADSPLGKLAAQFRTFGYKQTGFMWNEVLRKAIIDKDYKPLARFTGVSIPVGSAQVAVKGAIKAQPMTQTNDDGSINPAKQGLAAIAAVGGLGLPGSEIQNFAQNTKYNGPIVAAENTIGGPTASFINELNTDVQKAQKGNWKPLEKTAVRSTPVVGPAAAGRMFPKDTSKQEASKPITDMKSATIDQLNSMSDKERADIEKRMNKPGGFGITKLSNGKYWYQAGAEGKVTSDLKKAQKEVAEGQFKNSNEDVRLIGDTYYLKHSDGSIFEEPKVRYETSQEKASLKLEMDRAYGAKNPKRYADAANKYIEALDKLIGTYNPNTEQDKIDRLTLEKENLIDKANKYLSKGIGGGSGGGSSKNNPAANPYKYTVSLKAGGSAPSSAKAPRVSKSLKYNASYKNSSPAKISVRKSKV